MQTIQIRTASSISLEIYRFNFVLPNEDEKLKKGAIISAI